MSESPAMPSRRIWPPPPETADVKKEQIKLSATAMNAVGIALFLAGAAGPWITAIPDDQLQSWLRLLLVMLAMAIHLAARTYLRYMTR